MKPAVPSDTAPVRKMKRPLWRRVLRVMGFVTGGLVLLVALALGFLHTPWGKDVVRGIAEKRIAAKVNGSVSIGSLDYGFMFSNLSIGDLEIRDAKQQPAVKIASIDLVLDRGALLDKEIVLDELTIAGLDVQSPNVKGLAKKSNSKPLSHVQIKRLAIAGQVTITKPDGSVIAVRDLSVTGAIDARPAAKTLALELAHLGAHVELPNRKLDVAIDGLTLTRNGAIDVAIAKIAAGAIGIDGLTAHVERGARHSVTLGKVRVDSDALEAMLGKKVLLDDVAMELSVSGPESALVIDGKVKTRETTLDIDGKVDITGPTPRYEVALVGAGKSTDVTAKKLPVVQTGLRIDIKGSGRSKGDLDAELTVAVGPTKVGAIEIEAIDAKAHANRGAYKLESFAARGLGFEVTASGELAADKTLAANLGVKGEPAKAMRVLASAGIAIPRGVPAIGKVDLAITAQGKLDGELGVQLAPTKIAVLGGSVAITGDATLDNKKLRVAHTTVKLAGIRHEKATVSGSLSLTKTPTTRDATYDLVLAPTGKPFTIHAKGTADLAAAKLTADVRSANALVATLAAKIPLDAKGFQPRGAWKLELDVPEVGALLPDKKLPVTAHVHAQLGGTPAQPTGTVTVAAVGKQKIDLVATLMPRAGRLDVLTKGTVEMNGEKLALVDGKVAMPYRWLGKKPDMKALRAGLVVDATIDVPERPIASLAMLRPKLAELDGDVSGRIVVKGPAKAPLIDAKLAWRGYATASGARGETTIVAAGTPMKLQATIQHQGLRIVADVDRSTKDRIAIDAKLAAAKAPLVSLIPAFAAKRLALVEPGSLDTNLEAHVVLANKKLDALAVAGTLDVKGGAVKIPNSKRRYHDIALSLEGKPDGLAIKSLTVHEDKRTLTVSGHLGLDKAKPQRLDLALVTQDWLVFGGDKFGAPDAPRATAAFDIAVAADLAKPVIDVDATVKSLALRAPDRLERGHFPEKIGPGGDIIFVDKTTRVGALPYVPPPTPTVKKRRPMNIRVHIPQPIRVEQTPMDVMAKGELAVTVRDEGVQTRGVLTMTDGKLNLFGRDHKLLGGTLTFDDAHPKGYLALEFERILPRYAQRELSTTAGGAHITMSGSISKPKVVLAGAAGAAMFEVMSMYNAGRPVNTARPGLAASAQVQMPRNDQLLMLTFMASNLPHLLFLDRVQAWGDVHIKNFEADKYTGKSRVRAIVRPREPGRSEAEMQYDRLLIDNDRSALGVGVRAGDRIGGGLGLFFEWSSSD